MGFFSSIKFSKSLLLIDRKTIDICLFTFVIKTNKNTFNFSSNQGNANENNDIPLHTYSKGPNPETDKTKR